LDARHQAVEVRCGLRSHTNRTYISGRTDYLVLAITVPNKYGKQDFLVQDPKAKTLIELELMDCMSFPGLDVFQIAQHFSRPDLPGVRYIYEYTDGFLVPRQE